MIRVTLTEDVITAALNKTGRESISDTLSFTQPIESIHLYGTTQSNECFFISLIILAPDSTDVIF